MTADGSKSLTTTGKDAALSIPKRPNGCLKFIKPTYQGIFFNRSDLGWARPGFAEAQPRRVNRAPTKKPEFKSSPSMLFSASLRVTLRLSKGLALKDSLYSYFNMNTRIHLRVSAPPRFSTIMK